MNIRLKVAYRPISLCNTKYYIDSHFHLGDGGQIENIVLVQPQHVKLKIRPGSSQGVKFKIGQSPEYPLDLYFLLDLSWSMENTTKTVAEKGLCLTIKINLIIILYRLLHIPSTLKLF